ncbi:MAG: hypothetical protein LBI44_00345 [Oscillospiraceae bacterium]|jgi:hypothetical protein|nr:hypothetical protein [Oscillospiraceae bacterium]
MDIMTAEQALAGAKSHTFESVWATLDRIAEENERRKREADERHEQYKAEDERRKREADERYERYERERREAQREFRESQAKTEKLAAELSKNMGGLQNTVGRLVESMFTADLRAKFNELGYAFTRMTCRNEYSENNKVVAEVDAILENGEYILLAEVETEMRREFVDEHLERIGKVRAYMDCRNDRRKIIGAVAGGIVPAGVTSYAQKHGLFVITQSGESSVLAEAPEGFAAREW